MGSYPYVQMRGGFYPQVDLESLAKGIDYSRLPYINVAGVPLMTYGFILITTATLGIITMMDMGSNSGSSAWPFSSPEEESSILPSVGGKKGKKGGAKFNKTKKHHKK
jgi:hypothetical protein